MYLYLYRNIGDRHGNKLRTWILMSYSWNWSYSSVYGRNSHEKVLNCFFLLSELIWTPTPNQIHSYQFWMEWWENLITINNSTSNSNTFHFLAGLPYILYICIQSIHICILLGIIDIFCFFLRFFIYMFFFLNPREK